MGREYLGIQVDDDRNALLTDFGKETLSDRYLISGETYQDLFARVAVHFSDDLAHAQRLYDYISRLWFMPATPILSNGGTDRGLPISCFLNTAPDSLDGMWDTYRENMRLAASGGGIGTYWGSVRSIGETVGKNRGTTSGIIPFIKAMDSQTLAVSQGSIRRGSAAVYLQIDHPEIEEFLLMRKPTGGDPNRKALNLHHGIAITDEFMEAVRTNSLFPLRSPKTRETIREISARELWSKILEVRIETGEPYLLFIDTVNRVIPEWHKRDNLYVTSSNLCSEIVLPTTPERTAVCCLSSLNVETYSDWRGDEQFILDVMRFLDNVLQDFIDRGKRNSSTAIDIARAIHSAEQERSIGLGVMGFHSFLQKIGVPFESEMARKMNVDIWRFIKENVDKASKTLAVEKGPCPDAARHGFMERFSNKTSIAPTASISIICGGASPGIEPNVANQYTHKTLSGSYVVRNPYLTKLLDKYGKNDVDTWSSIVAFEGSVQHLDFLSDKEKEIFKTAFELDQSWVIRHAADRAPFIDQAASNNVFFPASVSKEDILRVHWQAWAMGVKSLYYCRTTSLKSAHTVGQKVTRQRIIDEAPIDVDKWAVCEACQ